MSAYDCPNNLGRDREWICLCAAPLDGSIVNGWITGGWMRYRLQPGEGRREVVKKLEQVANHAMNQWLSTL